MRKSLDVVVNSKASDAEHAQAELSSKIDEIKRVTEDLRAEEQHSSDLRKTISELKLKAKQEKSHLARAKRKISEMQDEIQALQGQVEEKSGGQIEDMQRLESKIASLRKSRTETAKEMEKLRLKLRAVEREKTDLSHQLHISRSEEEWSRREPQHVQQNAAMLELHDHRKDSHNAQAPTHHHDDISEQHHSPKETHDIREGSRVHGSSMEHMEPGGGETRANIPRHRNKGDRHATVSGRHWCRKTSRWG